MKTNACLSINLILSANKSTKAKSAGRLDLEEKYLCISHS